MLLTSVATLSSSRDPFELERLADELEAREHSLDTRAHDLPLYPPLACSNPFSLHQIRRNSSSHVCIRPTRVASRGARLLKEEFAQLINDDGEAFISLSTDLRGEDTRLERLKWHWEISSLNFWCVSYHPSCHASPRQTGPDKNRDDNSLLFWTSFRANLKKV